MKEQLIDHLDMVVSSGENRRYLSKTYFVKSLAHATFEVSVKLQHRNMNYKQLSLLHAVVYNFCLTNMIVPDK